MFEFHLEKPEKREPVAPCNYGLEDPVGMAGLEQPMTVLKELKGIVETVTISGFGLSETGSKTMTRHWRRGGFPPSFLARSEDASWIWRKGIFPNTESKSRDRRFCDSG
jgi:hypothetical protein